MPPADLLSTPRLHAFVTALIVLSFFGASTGIVLVNRYVLVDLRFHFPLLLSSLGLGFSFLTAVVMRAGRPDDAAVTALGLTPSVYWQRMCPVGALTAASYGFGNIAYLHLSVSYISILKAGTPAVVLAVLYAARLVAKPTRKDVLAVSVIALGTAVASTGEPRFSWLGLAAMLSSVVAEACKLAGLQHFLANAKLSLFDSLYFFSPPAIAVLWLFVIPLELRGAVRAGAPSIVRSHPGAFLLAASLGVCTNVLSLAIIQRTSALTSNVFGQLKNVVVVFCGALFLGEQLPARELLGYCIALGGFAAYSWPNNANPPGDYATGRVGLTSIASGQWTPVDEDRLEARAARPSVGGASPKP